MAELKILIREWQQGSLPEEDDAGFGAEALESLERKIRAGVTPAAEIPPDAGETDLVTAFCDEFAPELQDILGLSRNELTAAWTDTEAAIRIPDWSDILAGGEAADRAGRALAVHLLGAVLTRPERTAAVGETEAATDAIAEEIPEANGEEDTEEALETEGEETTEGEIYHESPPEVLKVIPPEFFGRGAVPPATATALKIDREIHLLWWRALTTAQSLLRSFGGWLAVWQPSGTAHFIAVGLAQAELAEFEDGISFTTEVTHSELPIGIRVDPPLHFLEEPPAFDYRDLKLSLSPFMAEKMVRQAFQPEQQIEIIDGGATVVLRDWSQTQKDDLRRLERVFTRMYELVRPPEGAPKGVIREETIQALLDQLGCGEIQGLAKCWRAFGDGVVGLRKTLVSRNGIVHKEQLQLALVLGAIGNEPIPDDLTSQLVRHGTATTWQDNELLFMGLVLDDPAEVKEHFHVFAEFGREAALFLTGEGALSSSPKDEWLPKLTVMPQRLEADYDRLHHHWRRRRQALVLDDLVDRRDLESAKSLLARVDDRDDKSFLRAHFVARLFTIDAAAALAELDAVAPGEHRHETVLALLEASLELAEKDLSDQVFQKWRTVDARQPHYTSDCIPLLELAASGLGLHEVAELFADDQHPAVQCDWLNFVFRRLPSVRRDLAWASRIDALVNDHDGLKDLNLERLADLFEVIRRSNLSGRESILKAVKTRVAGAEYQNYWENRFDIKLGDPPTPAKS